jgi:hypothetical protein
VTPYLHSQNDCARQQRRSILVLLYGALLLITVLFPTLARAQYRTQLTQGARYDQCSTTTTSDGKTIFKFRVQLIDAWNFMGGQRRTLDSWGAAVFFYDRDGSYKSSPSKVTVKMNQVASASGYRDPFFPTVSVYSGPLGSGIISAYQNNWHRLGAGYVTIEVDTYSSEIVDFPAISISMSLRSTMGDVWMDQRKAHLTANGTGSNGTDCELISPETKPPEPKTKPLTVKVPDWDFGELRANDPNQDIPLTEQLCLEYEPAGGIYSEKLLLNVSNQNGTTGQSPNMFKLVHRSDPNAFIPYSMRLRGSALLANVYRMPNSGATSLLPHTFNPIGKTCLDATYTTRTTTASKPGDYMDTITITISNQP